ncbi:MAG: hypothetical protein Pg6C_12590 [Treponemataceae bacterium]|nr:MAG: hypothetical protein Pg6C_12590 [Treponemataceae bacterium]
MDKTGQRMLCEQKLPAVNTAKCAGCGFPAAMPRGRYLLTLPENVQTRSHYKRRRYLKNC